MFSQARLLGPAISAIACCLSQLAMAAPPAVEDTMAQRVLAMAAKKAGESGRAPS